MFHVKLPNNVDKITLEPVDLSFLLSFNFDKVRLYGNHELTPEEIEYIYKHTNIKRIITDAPEVDYLIDYSKIDNEDIYVYKDIIVTGIDYEHERKRKVSITTNKLNINEVIKLIRFIGLKGVEEIEIKSSIGKYIFRIDQNNISFDMQDNNIDLLKEIYSRITSLGYKFSDICFHINNSMINENGKSKHYSDIKSDTLDSISSKCNLNIMYGGKFKYNAPYQEFCDLKETIKWYRGMIDENASPLEKLMYAYDIIKSFRYEETKDKSNSRTPHKIISSGKIVCIGYTTILEEILNGLDDNIIASQFGVACFEKDDKTLRGYHARTLVRIDDDKYDVHGIYVLDPTNDSYHESYNSKYREYHSENSYMSFLIPLKEYERVFPHDSFIRGINSEFDRINDKFTNLTQFNMYNYEAASRVFNRDKKSKTLNQDGAYSDRISFNKLLELIRNVRLQEGYPVENIDSEISSIIDMNKENYSDEEVSRAR